MPHYKDGTEAKVGDVIRGKPYNTPREIVGVVLSVTPNTESCNCVVAFVETQDCTNEEVQAVQKHVGYSAFQFQHVGDGFKKIVGKADHGETKAFEKIADAAP